MTGVEIAALISAIGNLFLGIWGLRKKKALDAVADGMVIVEKAVEENKDRVESIPGGKAITRTIKEYGPAARAAVDAARRVADALARKRYESKIIARERARHARRETDRR